MKMKNGMKSALSIWAILLVVYNVVLFIIAGFDCGEAFWISYVFVLIAFISMLIVGKLLGDDLVRLRDWIFGFPMISVTYGYVVIEIVLATIFMLLDSELEWQLPFVIQFIVLAAYAVLVIGCFYAKRTINDVQTKVKDKTNFIRMLRADAEMLVEKTQDPEMRMMCRKLAEDIRFSDPMSSEALFELEKEIALAVATCSDALAINDIPNAKAYCNKASVLLLERNKKCKVLK